MGWKPDYRNPTDKVTLGMGLPMGWKPRLSQSNRQSYPLISLAFIIMSARSTLIETAATLVDTNPVAAKFIVDLSNAQTGAEMIDAIDAYDQAVLDANTEVVAV